MSANVDSNENWSDHLKFLREALKNCPSKNSERDIPIMFYPSVWTSLANYIKPHLDKEHKSIQMAWFYLKEGNENCKSVPERISCYTESIFHAPENSVPLMIAYIKRSDLLYQMRLYQEYDCDSVMAVEYYRNYVKKLPEGRFHLSANQTVDVIESIMSETLEKMKMSEEELFDIKCTLNRLIQRHLRFDDVILYPNDQCHLPELKDGENVNFPSSSKALRVEYSQAKGRYVVADSDIKMGDVLFVEKPFSFVVHNLYCSHCCQYRYTYIPCTFCRDVQYCCKSCRDEDWMSCHRWECGYVDALRETGIGYLALKTFFKAECDIDELKDLINTLQAKECRSSTVFSQVTYENVYNLLADCDNVETEDFLYYSLTALSLSFYLFDFAEYGTRSRENVQLCSEILLRHIIQLVTNAHSIIETKATVAGNFKQISDEQVAIGSGIYPSTSMMNHSCDPSVFNTFHQYYIVVKARKDIKKGEEVFNAYGVDCMRTRRRERQEVLKAQYFFDCKCESCCARYDRYDILNSFKCEKCKGSLLKESQTENGTKSEGLICLVCSQHQIIHEEILNLEFFIGQMLKIGENYMEKDVLEALIIFLKAWKLARKFFFAFHKVISSLARKIARCLSSLGRLKDCMKVLSCNMVCVEGRFGLYSSEMAMETSKLREVIYVYYRGLVDLGSASASDVLTCKEKECMYKCKKILSLLYGDDDPTVYQFNHMIRTMNRLDW